MKLIIDIPKNVYKALKGIVETGCFDAYSLADIIVNKSKQIDELKPQSEWITAYSDKMKKVNQCKVCGFICIQGKTNFCANCGLPMKKGGADRVEE